MVRSGVCLLTAVLISNGIGVAISDLSGRWDLLYEGEIDRLACDGMVNIVKEGSTIHGDSILGSRGDGKLIGVTKGSAFSATITFRKKPAMFIKLDGCKMDDKLQGSYTAASSDGGFYRGKFTAARWDESGVEKEVDIDPIAPDDPLACQPTIFFDPDLYWHNYQFGRAKMDTYVINYSKNTILMVENKPFLWQWWL